MALIGMRNVSWGFGGTPLFENITFQVEKGERVCLLGRNGAGKSSIFRMLAGEIRPDAGEIWQQPATVVSGLEQEVPSDFEGTLFDVAAGGLGDLENLEPQEKWERLRQVESVLSRTGLDPDLKFAELSAGMKRRAMFARALACNPDVLLLDEPTNHLDIEAIAWMEQFLLRHVQTLLFITHDRVFLKKIATRIMELDRGRLLSFQCDYETYLSRRQALFEAEEKEQARFDHKLTQEEKWIRQGIKARRTRNEGRVRALEKMRETRRERRGRVGNVKMDIKEAERSGKLVIEARSISRYYDGRPVVSNFSTLIMRGDRVGIIGPNGAGKTTLLNILLKRVPPDEGDVRHGTNLKVAYFDQLRGELDETATVAENIAEGNDFVIIGEEKRHVISYLKDFLFSPERCRTPVRVLSGGEKNRLLLARLFTKPANLIVMDEPTNDLDVETLELLEELLFNFNGTVILVSHDREFLNNVVTGTIVFEETGEVIEYAGGYDDWLVQRGKRAEKEIKEKPAEKTVTKPKPRRTPRLGYKQMRELEALPQEIEAMEAEHGALYEQMADPAFYKKEVAEIARIKERMEELEKAIEYAYDRWEALENQS